MVPALVDVGLGKLDEVLGALVVLTLERRVARLLVQEVDQPRAGSLAVEAERVCTLGGARVEAVEGPVAAGHRRLLVRHRLLHVDAVRDAGRVGEHERRAGPGSRLEQSADCLGLVGAQGDLSDVHVAVRLGQQTEVLLLGRLSVAGELRRRTARRCLRRLATGVRVDLRVEHEDVDVAAGGHHVVEPAEVDVVGPAVAAHDPHRGGHQCVGQ